MKKIRIQISWDLWLGMKFELDRMPHLCELKAANKFAIRKGIQPASSMIDYIYPN